MLVSLSPSPLPITFPLSISLSHSQCPSPPYRAYLHLQRFASNIYIFISKKHKHIQDCLGDPTCHVFERGKDDLWHLQTGKKHPPTPFRERDYRHVRPSSAQVFFFLSYQLLLFFLPNSFLPSYLLVFSLSHLHRQWQESCLPKKAWLSRWACRGICLPRATWLIVISTSKIPRI